MEESQEINSTLEAAQAAKDPGNGSNSKKRKAGGEAGSVDLERKRAISRKSSQRNRQKQRTVLESLQTQQKTLNEKNRALKKDNDQLRERIAIIRRFGVNGLDPGQLDEAKRAAVTDTASVINGGGVASIPLAAVAASATTAAPFAPGITAAAAAAVVTNSSRRRLDLETLKALIQQPRENLTLPQQHHSASALQQLAFLQQLAQRPQPSPLQLLQQQVQNQFLPPFQQTVASSGSFASNLLQQLAAQQASTPLSALSAATGSGSAEDEATRLLLIQSFLGANSSAGLSAATAGGASSPPNRSRSADPPGNRVLNQYYQS